jgi:hypothetical protein
MADAFDPYHRWLGIPARDQPPNLYRLLGLERFEADPEVIRDAAEQRIAHVRTYQLGAHADLSQKILNELAAAKATLLDPERKAAYDAELGTPRPAVAPPTVIPPTIVPPPAPRRRPWFLPATAIGTVACVVLAAAVAIFGSRPRSTAPIEPAPVAASRGLPPVRTTETPTNPRQPPQTSVVPTAASKTPALEAAASKPPTPEAAAPEVPAAGPPEPAPAPLPSPGPKPARRPRVKPPKPPKLVWTSLFNGSSLEGWRFLSATDRAHTFHVENGELVSLIGPGANLATERTFKDFDLQLEFWLGPLSNSGVYLRGLYEIQLFDSTSPKTPPVRRCGAVHDQVAPAMEGAYLGPNCWNKITLRLVGSTLVAVFMNHHKIHNRVPLEGPTGGALKIEEGQPGPIVLQCSKGLVRFRNIQIHELP